MKKKKRTMMYKIEVYHPNSMDLMGKRYFANAASARKEFNRVVKSEWNTATLFKKTKGDYDPIEYN